MLTPPEYSGVEALSPKCTLRCNMHQKRRQSSPSSLIHVGTNFTDMDVLQDQNLNLIQKDANPWS